MKRKDVLEKAIECVCTDRNNQYGEPEDNFSLIAQFWSVYLETSISPHDVAMLMTLLKIARIKSGQVKLDNYADGSGYLACAYEIAVKGVKNETDL